MTDPRLGEPMPRQLPVERSLILPCGVCSSSHDARAIGRYDVDCKILYRADDGSDHEWGGDARVMLSTSEQVAEAQTKGSRWNLGTPNNVASFLSSTPRT